MTIWRYWPPPSVARRPWRAVWLKTHWTSRPTVTACSSGQTGPIEPEVDAGDRRGRERPEAREAGDPRRQLVGQEAADAVERDGHDHEVGGDPLARPQGHAADALAPSSSASTERTPVVRRTATPCAASQVSSLVP